AGEVKSLARQAAEATEQISREIDGVQRISDDVVRSLGQIAGAIDLVRQHVAATSGAVQTQGTVTREMSASMQRAALEIGSITENLRRIADGAQTATAAMQRTQE